IDAVVLSHNHWDHTGGLNALLATGIQPGVHLLPSFPAAMKQEIGQMTSVIETAPDQIISEGIFTTGEMNGDTPEQAIVIEVEQGQRPGTGELSSDGETDLRDRANAAGSSPGGRAARWPQPLYGRRPQALFWSRISPRLLADPHWPSH